jgi:histone H3/H4
MLPIASLKRVAKRAGAKRISADAARELRDCVQEIAEDLAKDAIRVAQHAGRVTIKKSDIKLVSK